LLQPKNFTTENMKCILSQNNPSSPIHEDDDDLNQESYNI